MVILEITVSHVLKESMGGTANNPVLNIAGLWIRVTKLMVHVNVS